MVHCFKFLAAHKIFGTSVYFDLFFKYCKHVYVQFMERERERSKQVKILYTKGFYLSIVFFPHRDWNFRLNILVSEHFNITVASVVLFTEQNLWFPCESRAPRVIFFSRNDLFNLAADKIKP